MLRCCSIWEVIHQRVLVHHWVQLKQQVCAICFAYCYFGSSNLSVQKIYVILDFPLFIVRGSTSSFCDKTLYFSVLYWWQGTTATEFNTHWVTLGRVYGHSTAFFKSTNPLHRNCPRPQQNTKEVWAKTVKSLRNLYGKYGWVLLQICQPCPLRGKFWLSSGVLKCSLSGTQQYSQFNPTKEKQNLSIFFCF